MAEVLTSNPDWKTYRAGQGDRAGRKIDRLYAVGDDYVIYFSGCELFYEIGPSITQDLGKADVALARINWLLPLVDPEDTKSVRYQDKYSTLELVVDAFEMIFCGEVEEGESILEDNRDKLQTAAEGRRRLFYQAGAVCPTLLLWLVYLSLHRLGYVPNGWEPWMLAAALSMAGGAFSVFLNLGSLQVTINQPQLFLGTAGATRSGVALLAGVGALLAMRASMVAGFAYRTPSGPPSVRDGLVVVEMFFCFLAGFSETFVPNILRNSEKNPGGGKAPDSPPPEPKAAPTAKPTDSASENGTGNDH
jgi:hypothetical protein